MDRFRVRRMMAISSYIQISLLIPLVLAIVFFGSELVSSNLMAASAVLITLIGALVAIIGHYNHMVYKDDGTKEKKDDRLDR
tara:strand:- start:23026 stop:23271 length:246 start_codon:yes stop_codon:yes gene_type:complete